MSELASAVAAERGRRWRIRRMSLIWKWQDSDRELIWSVNDMSESKMKPRLRAEELTGMISLPRDEVVSWENLSRCCFVPMSRNSVLYGSRSILLEFIQESMSEESIREYFKWRSWIWRSERKKAKCCTSVNGFVKLEMGFSIFAMASPRRDSFIH